MKAEFDAIITDIWGPKNRKHAGVYHPKEMDISLTVYGNTSSPNLDEISEMMAKGRVVRIIIEELS